MGEGEGDKRRKERDPGMPYLSQYTSFVAVNKISAALLSSNIVLVVISKGMYVWCMNILMDSIWCAAKVHSCGYYTNFSSLKIVGAFTV